MLQSTLLTLAFAFAGGTQTIHVDPVVGVDLPGHGAPALPVKTITFALAQIAPGNAADVWLHPGTYSEASGEIFPIVCVADTTITSVMPLQAHIKKDTLAFTTVFDVPTGSQHARFVGIAINTFDRGIVASVQSEDVLQLTVEGCEISGSKSVVVKVVDGVAAVHIEKSVMKSGDSSVLVNASGVAIVDVQTFDSTLGAFHGLTLESSGPSSFVTSLARHVIFDRCSFQGISVIASGGGGVDDVVEGCAFFRNALPAINPKIGAITESIKSGGFAIHTVNNCAFDGNGKELPDYDPTRWTVQASILQDPVLCALPTNLCGLPGFVNAVVGDFHLTPTSPAIDAGIVSAWTGLEDMEGDPRVGHPQLAGPPALDIGPDESYVATVHARPNPSALGSSVNFRLRGPSGTFAVLLFSAGTNGASFGGGLRVSLPLLTVPIVIGAVPAAPGGVADISFAAIVPSLPVLLDVVLYEQAAFATVSTIEWSYNVVEQRFR